MQMNSPRQWDFTAVPLALSAHWKLYPVIYGVSLLAVMASEKFSTVSDRQVGELMFGLKGLLKFKTVRFVSICES